MTKLPWKRGQLAHVDGPVVVSGTRFTYARARHMPGVLWNGLWLRAAWASFEGSVGVSTSVDLKARSTYTISVWRSEADLNAFIRHPTHLALMKRYRARLESSASAIWTVERFSLSESWQIARERVAGVPA
jgi:hypothetical protein